MVKNIYTCSITFVDFFKKKRDEIKKKTNIVFVIQFIN